MQTTLFVFLMMITSLATANVYKIDPTSSKIAWSAGKKIGKFHNGEINFKNGEIQVDKKGTVKSAKFVVDMKTISNIDLKDEPEYQAKLVGHLSNEDFFNVQKFPESTFKLTSITPKAGEQDAYLVKGELTMIGKTQTVEFPATMKLADKTLTGKGKLTIERLKWGLQYGSGSIFKSLTADKIINDSFELTLNFVAKP